MTLSILKGRRRYCSHCGILVVFEGDGLYRSRLERHLVICLLRQNNIDAKISLPTPYDCYWAICLESGVVEGRKSGWYVLEYGKRLVINAEDFHTFYTRLTVSVKVNAFDSATTT